MALKWMLPLSLAVVLAAPLAAYAVSPPEPYAVVSLSTPLGELGLYDDTVNVCSIVVLFDRPFEVSLKPRSVLAIAATCLVGLIAVGILLVAIVRGRKKPERDVARE